MTRNYQCFVLPYRDVKKHQPTIHRHRFTRKDIFNHTQVRIWVWPNVLPILGSPVTRWAAHRSFCINRSCNLRLWALSTLASLGSPRGTYGDCYLLAWKGAGMFLACNRCQTNITAVVISAKEGRVPVGGFWRTKHPRPRGRASGSERPNCRVA